MSMNEQQLRQLVRDAVARHIGGSASPHLPISPSPSLPISSPSHLHASHVLFAGLANVSDACVIEPSVACDHCGYCKSQGH